jgi:WD40 repeat protein
MRSGAFFLVFVLAAPASADSLKPESVLPWASNGAPAVAFSPDGKTLYLAYPNTTQLWETVTWRLRASFPYHGYSFAAAKDGQIVAATFAWADPVMDIFDASTGGLRNRFRLGKLDGDVFSAQALSPDGRVLALGCQKGLWLLDARTGKEISGSHQFKHAVDSLAFCLNGQVLAIGDQVGETRLWDVPGGKELGALNKIETPNTYQKRVQALAYSEDTATLAAVGGDNKIRVWDVKTRRERLAISVTVPRDAFFIAMSQEGSRIATVSVTGMVKVWDAKDGRELVTAPHGVRGFSIALSPDGKRLAVVFESNVRVWRLVSGSR